MHIKPLRHRLVDLFFAICFMLFVWSSLSISSLSVFNVPITQNSNNILIRMLYWYGSDADPLFIANPIYIRIMSIIDSFVFGPFYILVIYALIKGKDWIRIPAFLYVSAITYSMNLYLGAELFGEYPSMNIPKLLIFNLPYLVLPLALAYRLRHPRPFSNAPVNKS